MTGRCDDVEFPPPPRPKQMPKNESSNPNRVPSAQAPRPGPDWIVALACALVGAYLVLAAGCGVLGGTIGARMSARDGE